MYSQRVKTCVRWLLFRATYCLAVSVSLMGRRLWSYFRSFPKAFPFPNLSTRRTAPWSASATTHTSYNTAALCWASWCAIIYIFSPLIICLWKYGHCVFVCGSVIRIEHLYASCTGSHQPRTNMTAVFPSSNGQNSLSNKTGIFTA